MWTRRTVIACSWDGEEYALTGSTEWGEQFAEDLKKKLVAYLNVDESVAGAATTAGGEGVSFLPSAGGLLAPVVLGGSEEGRAAFRGSLYESWAAGRARGGKGTE